MWQGLHRNTRKRWRHSFGYDNFSFPIPQLHLVLTQCLESRLMDGWLDGLMDGWMDRWMYKDFIDSFGEVPFKKFSFYPLSNAQHYICISAVLQRNKIHKTIRMWWCICGAENWALEYTNTHQREIRKTAQYCSWKKLLENAAFKHFKCFTLYLWTGLNLFNRGFKTSLHTYRPYLNVVVVIANWNK